MKRSAKIFVTILAVAALLLYAFYSLTGFSVQPPKNFPPNGVTVWFFRRGTGMPFLSSPDSQIRKAEGSPSGTLVPLVPLENRVLARFAFNHDWYLKSTGGVEFLK